MVFEGNTKEVIRSYHFFQDIHIYPLKDKYDVEGWLSNFTKPEDLEIALRLVNFFMFFSEKMTISFLKSSINKAWTFIQEKERMDIAIVKEKCLYSYITGEEPNPTDSGPIFTRLTRDHLLISEDKFINFADISMRLRDDNFLILVDDFVGSGEQCIKSWERDINGFSLKESVEGQMIVIYAPLIINDLGFKRISNKCPELILSPTYILGEEYNLFSPECICWEDDVNLFEKGIDFIEKMSNFIGCSNYFTFMNHKGFFDQGLALSFDHCTPDATIPLFWFCKEGWNSLVKRSYERDKQQ